MYKDAYILQLLRWDTLSLESYRRYVGGVAAQLVHEEVMVDSRGGILLCLIEQPS